MHSGIHQHLVTWKALAMGLISTKLARMKFQRLRRYPKVSKFYDRNTFLRNFSPEQDDISARNEKVCFTAS